jgi:hypothetical protein
MLAHRRPVGERPWAACMGLSPMTTFDAHQPPGADPAGLTPVTSEHQVRALADEILDRDRDYPVVCLTSRSGDRGPALSGERVRGIVGPGIPVYFIAAHRLTLRLRKLLPERMDVFGGATRVWWPGITRESDPEEHLLVYDTRGVYGEEAYERLTGEFRVLERPRLTVEQRLVLSERARESAERSRREAERRLYALKRAPAGQDRGAIQTESSRERARECEPRQSHRLPGRADRELDFEQRLHLMLAGEWVCALTAADRRECPLGPYVFGREFAQMVEGRRVEVAVKRIAWVCAMVACGRAARAGCEVHRLRTGGGGNAAQLERSDGARAWRCNLKSSAGGPRLHYWALPEGTIEFASVAGHDDFSIPGG